MKITTIALACTLLPALAQEIKMPVNLDALAGKARDAVTVTLDKSMLQFAARFLHDGDSDEAGVRKLIAGLDGIYVKSFQFDHEGEYNMTDVDALRAQLKAPAWGRLVGVRSRHDGDVDVYFKTEANGTVGGMVVIAAEPRELTIVNINGALDPEHLVDLSGEFGIPRLERAHRHHREDQ